jgi:hypothetical protein
MVNEIFRFIFHTEITLLLIRPTYLLKQVQENIKELMFSVQQIYCCVVIVLTYVVNTTVPLTVLARRTIHWRIFVNVLLTVYLQHDAIFFHFIALPRLYVFRAHHQEAESRWAWMRRNFSSRPNDNRLRSKTSTIRHVIRSASWWLATNGPETCRGVVTQ